MDEKLRDAKQSLNGISHLFEEVEQCLSRKRSRCDTVRRAFQYFDKYLAEEGESKNCDITPFDLEQTMKDMASNGARIVGRNMLVYFTIGRLALEKLDDESLQKVHDMVETAIKNYSNPSAPNARFTSLTEVAAGSSSDQRSVGMIRGASGYLPRDDKYFVKESHL
ncbi:hypothetical protein BWQ96_09285 [Gracilariopsis chorda]|uniref:Uncharacterized protein n=1 Tax=Gracilariopsis chorda TaxID=448386 RepID=A0A2V3IIP1_9FLOR|nr:hypothetical protein BWQ96_09285 [Gracilariopsis chorda]|eukprot:PXF40990.1 hypothetical protein BWQ96_09285 [Gracilariopsis chorda]